MISLVKPDTFKISAKHAKTNIYGLAFILKITRKNAVGSALLAEIFNNGSRVFKGPVEMNTRLNNMDGAVFNAGCVKKGDNICLCVSLECLKSISDHTAEGFIDDIVFKPMLNGEAFDTFAFVPQGQQKKLRYGQMHRGNVRRRGLWHTRGRIY